MGLLLEPMPEIEQENLTYNSDGNGIIEYLNKIDEICNDRGIRNLSSFIGDEESFDAVGEVFHDIQDALNVLEVLESELQHYWEKFRRKYSPDKNQSGIAGIKIIKRMAAKFR